LRWLLGLLASISWGAALLIAATVSHFAQLNFLLCPAITGGALLVNGWVATLEDDLPGGFNDPDGKRTPNYANLTWVVQAVGAVLPLLLLLILGLSFFGSR
jgi:hypothetical protein